MLTLHTAQEGAHPAPPALTVNAPPERRDARQVIRRLTFPLYADFRAGLTTPARMSARRREE